MIRVKLKQGTRKKSKCKRAHATHVPRLHSRDSASAERESAGAQVRGAASPREDQGLGTRWLPRKRTPAPQSTQFKRPGEEGATARPHLTPAARRPENGGEPAPQPLRGHSRHLRLQEPRAHSPFPASGASGVLREPNRNSGSACTTLPSSATRNSNMAARAPPSTIRAPHWMAQRSNGIPDWSKCRSNSRELS